MFSQFRQAVEILSPQPRRGLQDTSEDARAHPRAHSLDVQGAGSSSPLSSSQLAESALSNLRKSLATQRSGSPGPASLPKSNSLPDTKAHKSNLEERLRRATFAIGDVSNGTTPVVSTRASPSPLSATKLQPLSPSSIPLPESPISSPKVEVSDPDPITFLAVEPLLPLSLGAPDAAPPNEVNEQILVEADIPCPQSPTEGARQEVAQPDLDNAPVIPDESSVYVLQERLRLFEQRFADVSSSYKRLQSEKAAADLVIRELTPLENTQDIKGLRNYLQSLSQETKESQDEINRLRGKLARQDERIEELRDTHRLESVSRSDQIDSLRRQLEETEALLNASLKAQTHMEEENAKRKADMDQLKSEVERAKGQAKDEEEKRVKAISLLKTVRQKLVKAEKEKEDATRELNSFKDRDRGDREKEQTEKANLQREIDAVNAEREKAIIGLRAQFDRDLKVFKERSEQELQALRGQFELEAVTSKSVYVKELATKDSQISSLESSVNVLSRDKNIFFDQLQQRQAELESSQYHLESLQSQNTELQYQLREANDRLALLSEELLDARREQDAKSQGPTTSAEDVARLLSASQVKYESRIGDLKRNLDTMERERNEGEAEWSRKLREKSRETDDLRRASEMSAKAWEQKEYIIKELKAEKGRLLEEISMYRTQVSDFQILSNKMKDVENAGKSQSLEFEAKVDALERQIEDCKNREGQLRVHNKTLREELRKVQSSAALLERQRNPGVGYWTSRPENTSSEIRTSMSSSSSDIPSPTASPGPPLATAKDDEAINLEYLRNVILQFLEHKEMRPNLVRVLSIILHFTPQETRRLVAKV